MELSTKIKDARAKLKLTGLEAAKAWRVNPRTLQEYEQGRRKPRGLALTALTDILDAILSAVSPARESFSLNAAAPGMDKEDSPLPPASSVSPAPPDAPASAPKRPRQPKQPPKAKRRRRA